MAEDVSDKELIPQIYKELIQFNSNKIKLTQWGKKWTDWTIFFFSQQIPTDSQEVHEKRFNITDDEGNANQNHNEMSLHT